MAANVPPLNENPNRGGRILTMRERMEEHRAQSRRARSATRSWIPIGLSLENFDAVGAWRDARRRQRHRSGHADRRVGRAARRHQESNGVVTLRQALLRQPELFVGTVTEKLMIYALGRGLQPYDMPAVRAIVRDTAPTNYRFSSSSWGS